MFLNFGKVFKFMFFQNYIYPSKSKYSSNSVFKMPTRILTCLSHGILAGTSLYCISRLHTTGPNWYYQMPIISYGLCATHSILGCYYWANDDRLDIASIYELSQVCRDIFAFPLIVGQLYLFYNYRQDYAYMHPAVGLVPFILYVSDKRYYNLLDLVIFGNIVSCGVSSFLEDNYWGMAAAVSAAFSMCFNNDYHDIPAIDFHNFSLCFCNVFSLLALTDRKIF